MSVSWIKLDAPVEGKSVQFNPVAVLTIICPVIENTLNITLTPSYRNSSSFFLDSNLPVFLESKSFFIPQANISLNKTNVGSGNLARINDSRLYFGGFTLGDVSPFIIKIEVYN